MCQPIRQTQREIDDIFQPQTVRYVREQQNSEKWVTVTSKLTDSDGSVMQVQKIYAKASLKNCQEKL